MPRLSLPAFVHEVVDDPRQRGILVAGSLAVFAAGLVPRLLAPGLPAIQSSLRSDPGFQSYLLVAAFLSAAVVLVGGVIGDIWRRRRVLVGALLVMVASDATTILLPDGPFASMAELAGITAAAVVLTFAIGSVALAYEGVARATALGVVYAAYGAATAAATPLLLLLGQSGPYWPAYLAAGLAAAIAVVGALRGTPELPGHLPARRAAVIDVGLWGVAILAIVTGLVSLLEGGDRAPKVALVLGGVATIGLLALRRRRDREALRGLALDRRTMAAALSMGVVVGFAQAVPLMVLPAIFQYVLVPGYQPAIWATVAIAPFVIAMLLAGPVSGILLARFEPRTIALAGCVLLALGDILVAGAFALFGRSTGYAWLIVPLAAIGAGFVIATTVRTAIVFSATPRGLPATAAGYNEASVGLGSRIGMIVSTVVVAEVATASVSSRSAGSPDLAQTLAAFQRVLVALGTPGFGPATAATTMADRGVFASAYLDGVIVAILASGIAGLAGAALAWVLIGRRDPLRTVFDLRDERTVPSPPPDDDAGPGRRDAGASDGASA
jgi:MFS family permease